MDLTKELEHLIKTDDANALKAMLTKSGRPQRGTRAITEEDKSRCLGLAIPEGSLEMIELLIQHGACLTPCSFFAAMRREEPELLELFIKRGWDMDSTRFGQSTVQAALTHPRILIWLLENGANPNTISNPRPLGSCADRLTPLAAAAQFSDPGPAQTLLDHGAEVYPLTLFYAMQQQNENGMATTRLLLEHGADLNHVARNWGTPLCYAVQQGDRQTLEYLLEKGANPSMGSENRGMLPVELARFCGKSELAEILEKAMPRRSKWIAERASNVDF